MRSLSCLGCICLFFLVPACTPPVFVPPIPAEEMINPNWSNLGDINANFIATSRNLGVRSNAGSPTFQISFIASASNIDSLSWSFPGGVTQDSISDVTEIVTYHSFGQYDVGLEVFNIEDKDRRFFENFIEIFYKDPLVFSDNDATSWIVTGTGVSPSDFVPYRTSSGNSVEDWITIPFEVTHQVRAEKQFSDFPKNNLVLEFDYRLERVPVFYIDHQSFDENSSLSSPSIATYIDPLSSTASDVRIETPSAFPGARRFYIEYNGIPLWVSSNLDDAYFEHVRIELPSQSNFNLGIVREAQALKTLLVPFPNDALPQDNPYTLNSSLTMDVDLDRDGIADTIDNDIDGDGYLNATETGGASDSSMYRSNPNDAISTPQYATQYVAFPYILNIRNMTLKVREED